MFCSPQVVSDKWPAAVEAAATLLLVIAAGFQWWAMRTQAAQERKRWQREDEIRAEENKPKAEFWFERKSQGYDLLCANLGLVTFILKKISVECVPFHDDDKATPISGEKEILVNGLDLTRTASRTPINAYIMDKLLRRHDNGYNFQFNVHLKGPSDTLTVVSKPFYWATLATGQNPNLNPGFTGCVTVKCPKCNLHGEAMSVEGLSSKKDVEDLLKSVHAEYAETCPNHVSKSNKKVIYPAPPIDAPRFEG